MNLKNLLKQKYNSIENKKGGFIRLRTILVIISIIIILSYFGVDLQSVIEDPGTQHNIGYVWGGVVTIWNNYLETPLTYLWNDIFIDLIWSSFIENLQRLRDGQGITLTEYSPIPPPVNLTP